MKLLERDAVWISFLILVLCFRPYSVACMAVRIAINTEFSVEPCEDKAGSSTISSVGSITRNSSEG